MSYYKSNRLYESIIEGSHNHFKFVSGNIWQLVYGDAYCDPKLLVLASGVNGNNYSSELNPAEQEAFLVLQQISEASGIPLRVVKFNIDLQEVSEVITYKQGEIPLKVSMDGLRRLFSADGVPVSNSPTRKYLNDASSSAYHNWQRESLGRELKVSDFDLWKVDRNGNPLELYELKRSFISLDRWQPYPDDYNNFRLIYNVIRRTNLTFKIVYNVRKKNPWVDDVSKVKLFNVDFRNHNPIQFLGIQRLEEFLSQ